MTLRLLVPAAPDAEAVRLAVSDVFDVEGIVFAGPAEVRVEAVRRGASIRLSGTIAATIRAECDRCLASVEIAVREAFTTDFDPSAGLVTAVDLGVDDETALIERIEADAEGDLIDATEEVRMRLAQAVPDRVLCRADCRGLCPTCGADRNAGACACPASAGSVERGARGPFADLATLLEGRI